LPVIIGFVKLSEIGEFRMVELIAEAIRRERDDNAAAWQNLVIGIGDDAAAWRDDSSMQLATVDSLVQGVHFSPGRASPEDLGWKALAVNLSDIAAMGGIPTYALVYLGLPADTESDDVISIYRGMSVLARQFGVAIIGGDTDRLPQMVITITVLGKAPNGQLLRRSNAKAGDLVAVTGYLGSAAGGFTLLNENRKINAGDRTYLRNAFLRPVPRVKEGRILVESGILTAMDISDGLISDLGHICRASEVGAVVHAAQIPVAGELMANFSPAEFNVLAMSGGEDYELLFTGSPSDIEKVRKLSTRPVTVIGEIIAGSGVIVVDENGSPLTLKHKGWEHFITSG
jgi:thiamine-monophosphate kinase